MADFFPRHSDAPSARVDLLLARWRERLLRPILWGVALIASLSGAISAWQFVARGQSRSALLTVALVGLLWAAALLRFAEEQRRMRLALVVTYGAAVLSLTSTGLGAGGLMGMFGFVALSALLLDKRGLGYAVAAAALTVVAVALGFRFGLLEGVDPRVLDSTNLLNWLGVGSFAVSILAAVGGVSLSLLRTLTTTLEERGELVKKLRAEVGERERAHEALAEAQQRLIHAHKLEAVGRLAGGIAHDFNNTLTVILSYSELLRKRLAEDRDGSDLADQIVRAAEQGSDLTKQLLTFSRRQVVKVSNVDVQQIVKDTERALGRLVQSSIRVHCTPQAQELCVRIDPTQLGQALLNLALNARDAMPEGGDLYLETAPIMVRESDGLPIVPGAYVVIRVRDTGCGMSDDTLARIFEPFFTTKAPGLGTGLGLANVREATEAVGGHVQVKSELGRGTEFALYLPRTEGRVSGVKQRDVAARSQVSILVVEDEPQIRDVISAILIDAGHAPHVALGAKHALELAGSQSYDLLWVDLVMPDMPGSQVIDEFLRLHPSTPVLVCSAYGTDEQVSQRVARGELTFLAKPFTRKALIDAVDRALTSGLYRSGLGDEQAASPPRFVG